LLYCSTPHLLSSILRYFDSIVDRFFDSPPLYRGIENRRRGIEDRRGGKGEEGFSLERRNAIAKQESCYAGNK